MHINFRLSFILVVLTLLGCDAEPPSSPACRNVLQHDEFTSSLSRAAGCVIVTEGKMLFITHRLSGKLDIPGGGQDDNESLACTAHRETWEETGFNVEVNDVVGTTSKGMTLFSCHLDAGIAKLPDAFAPPPWRKIEVISLQKHDPFTLTHDALRFPDDLIPLRDAFIVHDDISKKH
ncbi:NUDIX hydrolase [Alteromonas sp. A079]|uniref:NUDIX hydrolase n=1 Tax=Alteromonas sp. A079 TaxID=3410268 RepID=UPI003B9F536B